MSSEGTVHRFPAGIPIIGQLATVKAWAAQVVVQCNCEDKQPVLLPVGGLGECPSCHRKFGIQTIQFNAQTNQAQISVGLVATREDAIAGNGVSS
jgi:hypothetical protein